MNNSITNISPLVTQGTKISALPRLLRDARGLSTVEYVILLALIAVAGIGLWGEFGSALGDKIGAGTDAVREMGGSKTPMPGL